KAGGALPPIQVSPGVRLISAAGASGGQGFLERRWRCNPATLVQVRAPAAPKAGSAIGRRVVEVAETDLAGSLGGGQFGAHLGARLVGGGTLFGRIVEVARTDFAGRARLGQLGAHLLAGLVRGHPLLGRI